jgi:2-amino-4-hydroxy-6-hydroxymethyldihydropteridine diphosphokinase
MNKIYLSLGSNIGNSLQTLQLAATEIEKKMGKIILHSSYYQTAAWGNKKQSDFINQVIAIESAHNCHQLMVLALDIEKCFGRIRLQKWEARILDIDIISFGQEIIDEPDLKVPHPLMHERKFVLIPMKEINPDFVHPLSKINIDELLKACVDDTEIKKLSNY